MYGESSRSLHPDVIVVVQVAHDGSAGGSVCRAGRHDPDADTARRRCAGSRALTSQSVDVLRARRSQDRHHRADSASRRSTHLDMPLEGRTCSRSAATSQRPLPIRSRASIDKSPSATITWCPPTSIASCARSFRSAIRLSMARSSRPMERISPRPSRRSISPQIDAYLKETGLIPR